MILLLRPSRNAYLNGDSWGFPNGDKKKWRFFRPLFPERKSIRQILLGKNLKNQSII